MTNKVILFLMLAPLAGLCAKPATQYADYGKLTIGNMPSIRLIVKNAAKASTSGQDNFDAVRRRIRASYLLPTLRIQYEQETVENYQYGYNTINSSYYYPGDQGDGSSDYSRSQTDWYNHDSVEDEVATWYVEAKWALNKLITDKEQIYLSEVTSRASYYQQNTIKNVTDIYRDLVTLLYEKQDVGTDVSLLLDIYAAAAELDYLTGDYLSAILHRLDAPEAAPAKVSSSPARAEQIAQRKEVKQKEAAAKSESAASLSPFDMMLDDE